MDAYEVMQRETGGPEDYAQDELFRNTALKVLGVTEEEIKQAEESLATYERPIK